jgi:hypothetical protein
MKSDSYTKWGVVAFLFILFGIAASNCFLARNGHF